MFRVAVDCYHFVGVKGGSGGTGHYLFALLESLARVTRVVVVASPDNARFFEPLRQRLPRLSVSVGERSAHGNALRSMVGLADVLFAPFTSLPERDTYRELPAVTAIHDLQHRALPGFFAPREREERDTAFGNSVRVADGVVTFSNVERDLIRKTFDVRVPMRVIAHAPFLAESLASLEGLPAESAMRAKLGRYVVYPAVNWPHKNHYRLVEAFRQLRANPKHRDLRLVLTGADCVEDRDHVYRELVREASLEAVVTHMGYVTNRQLHELLRGAEAMVFPTLYEGFGIPTLEAMRIGAPVIASDLPVFREWLADTFVPLRDPRSPRQMAADIAHALENPSALAKLRERARVKSLEFSSERMAAETLEFLRSVAENAGSSVVVGSEAPARKPSEAPSTKIHIDIDAASLDSRPAASFDALVASLAAFRERPSRQTASFHFLVAEPPGEVEAFRAEADAKLGKLGSVSFYDAASPAERALAIRFQVGNYADADFHVFVSAKNLVAQGAQETLGQVARFRPRIDSRVDAYFLQGTPWKSVRERVLEQNHRAPGKLDSAIADCPELRSHHFAIATDAFRRLGGDPFTLTFAATLVSAARVKDHRRKFAYLEPELARYVGHHYGMARTTCHSAELAGFECVVGASRAWSASLDGIANPIEVLPTFSSYRNGGDPEATASRFAEELITFLAQAHLRESDTIYLHMPYPQLILGVLEVVATLPLHEIPTFCIRLCTDDDAYGGHGIQQSKVMRTMDRLGRARRARVRFSVESTVLQNIYRTATAEELPVLFNPVSTDLAAATVAAAERRARRAADAPVAFGYFGEAREEKGFLLMPDIVEKAIERFGADKVRFLIQVSTAPVNDTQPIKDARARLVDLARRPANAGAIKLHDEFSDMASYYGAMAGCDVILIPYSQKAYAVRGSGVTLEAFHLGCPVVVTDGTDMATTFAGEACVVAPYTANGFVERCGELLQAKDELVARVTRFMASSGLFRSDAEYIETLTKEDAEIHADAPVVIWVGNDVLSQGVSAVYKAQRAFFRRQGYEVFNFYVPYPDGGGYLHSDQALEKFLVTNALGWGNYRFDFDCHSWIANQERQPGREELLKEISTEGGSTDRLTALNTYTRIPQGLRRLLQNRDVQVVCMNYVHLMPVLAKLGITRGRGTRIVLETHDIQAYQHALRANHPPDLDEVERELTAMGAADKLVAISRHEEAEIREFDTRYDVRFVLPTIESSDELASWKPAESKLGLHALGLWASRPDLQRAFDLRTVESLEAYFRWVALYGRANDAVLADATAHALQSCPKNHPAFAPNPANEIPYLVGLIWLARADLRRAFPNAQQAEHSDRDSLLSWFKRRGIPELKLSPEGFMTPSPGSKRPKESTALVEALALGRPKRLLDGPLHKEFASWHAKHPTVDVLIVGSDHPSNVTSARWFLREVYQRYLQPAGVGLVLAGRICDPLRDEPAAADVLLLGEMERLDGLYRVARVVAAPVITGTGTPIKVLDAFALGLCLSVSSFVDRALNLSGEGFPMCSTAADFADDIRALLASEGAREKRRELGLAFGKRYLSAAAYDAEWTKLVVEGSQVALVRGRAERLDEIRA